MDDPLALTVAERDFLRHWHHEAGGPFWGPATIWCVNQRVNPAYGPYPLAELFWDGERAAGRTFWTGERPGIPFRVPWRDTEHFWDRVNAALRLIPRLQGDPRFTPAAFCRQYEGTLTPEESNYLRAYNREMVESGSGDHVDLADQHGVLGHHLIPFFILLDHLYGQASPIASFPWTDFPSRYREVSGREHDFPDFALTPG
ncbi:hypothetical protein BH23PLA1_BH23PLA1_17900 [soil metagenome]